MNWHCCLSGWVNPPHVLEEIPLKFIISIQCQGLDIGHVGDKSKDKFGFHSQADGGKGVQ